MSLFFYTLTLLRHYFSSHSCCAYHDVLLFFLRSYPAVLTLLCFFFLRIYLAVLTLLCLPCCAHKFFFSHLSGCAIIFSHLPCYSYPAVPLFSFCCALTPYSVPYCAYPAVLLFLFFAFTLLCLPCCALIFFSHSTTRLCHYFSSLTRKGTE